MNGQTGRLQLALPNELAGLQELALDVLWSFRPDADALWRRVDDALWEATRNPWLVLHSISAAALAQLAKDRQLVAELQQQLARRRELYAQRSWYAEAAPAPALRGAALFSMEFGLSEALPLYSGGLGVLAGDFIKAASDLGAPVVGVGLMYHSGSFRQHLDADGRQVALASYNDPTLMPVTRVLGADGESRAVCLALPGRTLRLRIWQVSVGRCELYLLDSNDPTNTSTDRTITSELYPDEPELRLQQEIVLGIGGYRLLNELGLDANVVHLNEGHAAFAVLERARAFMQARGVDFWTAWACCRAGNLFTTHTSMSEAFDRYPAPLMRRYFEEYVRELAIPFESFLALGSGLNGHDVSSFSMPTLAIHGAGSVNAVSRLHGSVSRDLFRPLFPHWPVDEVPISHITNGVHVPTWESAEADTVWEDACGAARWQTELATLAEDLRGVREQTLWNMRNQARHGLIQFLRARMMRQLAAHGDPHKECDECATLFDPDVLTIGFARRFASYKRPNLLLLFPERLQALLTDANHPVQLVFAGKAHPNDAKGMALLQAWHAFLKAAPPAVRRRVLFIEDYDLAVAQRLVRGIDVWLNTPRRPWEACGTSGMKVLVNGGLNVSVLDGWWAELYRPELGYAIQPAATTCARSVDEQDRVDAEALYQILNDELVPCFYHRDSQGIPVDWLKRVRESMASLAAPCSANRMVREYVQDRYAPLAARYEVRADPRSSIAADIVARNDKLRRHWPNLRFGELRCQSDTNGHELTVSVFLDGLDLTDVDVELYADSDGSHPTYRASMTASERLAGHGAAYNFKALVPADRPVEHYTPRIVPRLRDGDVTLELGYILWQR